ncbi:MAG: hypothetical protein NT007_09410 [Candidatus Kapabacteria bacterium]|nr:hypothetical protein [Candidatus Kapabacteria bacterium]
MKIELLTLLFICFFNCSASDYFYFNNIQNSVGLTSLESHYYSQNPAQLVNANNSVSFWAKPIASGLPELNIINLGTKLKIDSNFTVALDLNGIVNNLYSEFSPNLSLSYKYIDKLSAGANLTYNLMGVKNFKSCSFFSFDIGAIIFLNDYLSTGFVLRNINRGSYLGGNSLVNQTVICGFGIKANDDFLIDIDWHIKISQYSGLSLAGKYKLYKAFYIRLAYLTNPNSFETGISIGFTKDFNLNYNFCYDMNLGSINNVCITFQW